MNSAAARNIQVEKMIQQAFAAGKLKGLHSMLVTLKGETFAEVYFPGVDQNWGTPLGEIEHGPETLHDLRSVTKSIVSLLYGIALSDSLVPKPSDSLIGGFPEYEDLFADEARRKITIEDALTMQMGLEWDESLPYSDPRNSEIAMEYSKDRYRFVLEQQINAEPGQTWHYNGGATAVIAKLIAKGAGMNIEQYAVQKLFKPLGISNHIWNVGRDGEPSAASGLRLNINDLAKIGQLISNGGRINGRLIIPAGWLKMIFTPKAQTAGGLRYGYQWYLAPQGTPPSWVSGFGNGGQRLTVQAKYDLVIVVFAGNYNNPEAWKVPVSLLEKYVFPELTKAIKNN